MAIEILHKDDKRPRFERSIETQLIIDRLSKCTLDSEESRTVTYEEISKIVRYNIQKRRSCLDSARKILLSEKRMFGVITNVGIYLMDDEEVAISSGKPVKKIHSTANRGKKQLTAIGDYNKLSDEAKRKYNLNNTLLTFTAKSTTTKAIKKIEDKVSEQGDTLSYRATLEHFA